MAYYAWNDYSSFVVALDVARAARRDFDAAFFEAWARREAALQPFAYDTHKVDEFLEALRS